jgi:hypothetical protein
MKPDSDSTLPRTRAGVKRGICNAMPAHSLGSLRALGSGRSVGAGEGRCPEPTSRSEGIESLATP